MDFSRIYKKLPKRIRRSDYLTYHAVNISSFFHKLFKSKNDEKDPFLNFLFKSTNLKADGNFRKVQLLALELLKFIDNVCKKYDITYFLIYGSLLGAIRHGGFIPWDDDLDIMMMRKDYNKLIEVLPYEINKNDYLKENIGLTLLDNINDNYFDDTNHILDESYVNHFLANDSEKSRFLQLGFLKPLAKLDIFPFDYIKNDSVDIYNKKYRSQKFLFRNDYFEEGFSYFVEINERSKKIGLTMEETDFIGEGLDATYWDDFGAIDVNLFFPINSIEFEGVTVMSPNQPLELLKFWYGENYMDIPSNLDIHNFNDFNKKFYDSDDEISQAFLEAIATLKDINENFD